MVAVGKVGGILPAFAVCPVRRMIIDQPIRHPAPVAVGKRHGVLIAGHPAGDITPRGSICWQSSWRETGYGIPSLVLVDFQLALVRHGMDAVLRIRSPVSANHSFQESTAMTARVDPCRRRISFQLFGLFTQSDMKYQQVPSSPIAQTTPVVWASRCRKCPPT